MKKLLFVLLLLPTIAFAQSSSYDSTKNLTIVSAIGQIVKNLQVLGQLKPASDTFKMAVHDSGSFVIKSNVIYIWNGYKWKLSSGEPAASKPYSIDSTLRTDPNLYADRSINTNGHAFTFNGSQVYAPDLDHGSKGDSGVYWRSDGKFTIRKPPLAVLSIIPGTNVSVDNSDPENPVVRADDPQTSANTAAILQRVKYTDTALMLLPYLRKLKYQQDSTAFANNIAAAFNSLTKLNDSTYTFNRPNGSKDTLRIISSGGGGSGTPGGASTQVQFNSSGAFAGDANFVWDNTNKRLNIGNPPIAKSPVTVYNNIRTQATFYGWGPNGAYADQGQIQVGGDSTTALLIRQDGYRSVIENTFPNSNTGVTIRANGMDLMTATTGLGIQFFKNIGLGINSGRTAIDISSYYNGWVNLGSSPSSDPPASVDSYGLLTSVNSSGGGGETSLLADVRTGFGVNRRLRLGTWDGSSKNYCLSIFSNSAVVGSNDTESSSSAFTVNSTTKGVLLARMTTTEKLAISSPDEGLEVYDLTLHQKSYWNGTAWINY